MSNSQVSLSSELKQILVGLLLGDACGSKKSPSSNARIKFHQGLVHKEYLLHLFELFNSYCLSVPKIITGLPNKITGKVHSSIWFQTRSLPCFTELYELFYPDGTKTIPLNIGELLTPLGLAFWIADDGGFEKSRQRVTLSTEGFTLEELNLLAKTLNDKWDLKCTINKHGNGFRIRIPKKSLPKLQDLLKDIMPPMMLHKIGL